MMASCCQMEKCSPRAVAQHCRKPAWSALLELRRPRSTFGRAWPWLRSRRRSRGKRGIREWEGGSKGSDHVHAWDRVYKKLGMKWKDTVVSDAIPSEIESRSEELRKQGPLQDSFSPLHFALRVRLRRLADRLRSYDAPTSAHTQVVRQTLISAVHPFANAVTPSERVEAVMPHPRVLTRR